MKSLQLMPAIFVCVLFALLLGSFVSSSSAFAADSVSQSSVAQPASVSVVPAVEDAGILSKIASAASDWIQALSLLIAAASAIAALTPTPKDDGVILVLRKIVDFLALNFGGAKNEAASGNTRNNL